MLADYICTSTSATKWEDYRHVQASINYTVKQRGKWHD